MPLFAMSFHNPQALWAALLALPLAALYLWRGQRRPIPVATGFLWQEVLGQEQRQGWLGLRWFGSLALQLLALGLFVLALADPMLAPPKRTVLVIDNAASMNARDVSPSRLDEAKRLARTQVDSLGLSDQMAVIATHGSPDSPSLARVISAWSDRREPLVAAIATIRPTKQPHRTGEAIAFARRLLVGQPGGRIVVLSDGCFAGARELASDGDVRWIPVGKPSGNVAITRLSVRRALDRPEVCQVHVVATNFGDNAVSCRLAMLLDGKLAEDIPVEIPATPYVRLFSMTCRESATLVARLSHDDPLPEDNEAAVTIPALQTIPVRITGANPRLASALAADPLVKLVSGDGDAPPADAVHVFCGPVPDTLPKGPVLAIDPDGPCDAWSVGEAVPEGLLTRQADDHPVLDDVRLEGVSLAKFKSLRPTPAFESNARPLAWTAEGSPTGYAIDRPSGRVVVLCGVLDGDLPQKAAFPVLVGNALHWLAASRPIKPRPLVARPESPPHSESQVDPRFRARDQRSRLYDSAIPDEEHDLCVPEGLGSQAVEASSGFGLPLWSCLAGLAIVLLALEWAMYHRRWTC